jgi:hypothetical protein
VARWLEARPYYKGGDDDNDDDDDDDDDDANGNEPLNRAVSGTFFLFGSRQSLGSYGSLLPTFLKKEGRT